MTAAARQRAVFAALLRTAEAEGELAKGADIDALSWHYLGVMQAVLSFPETGAGVDTLGRMIDVAMAAWPTSAA